MPKLTKSGLKKIAQQRSGKAALSVAAGGSKGVVSGALIADIIEKQRAEWADLSSHLPAQRTRKPAVVKQEETKKKPAALKTWPAEEFFHEASKLSYVDHNH